jgi:hypothetical protein
MVQILRRIDVEEGIDRISRPSRLCVPMTAQPFPDAAHTLFDKRVSQIVPQ